MSFAFATPDLVELTVPHLAAEELGEMLHGSSSRAKLVCVLMQISVGDRGWMTHGNPEAPYFLSFQHCIVEAAHHADTLAAAERVGFTFDRQDSFGAEATRLYNKMKDDLNWENRHRLADTVAFASKRNSVPLQAADFAAYETYKQLENKLYHPEIPARWPIRQFRERPFTGKYFTREALQDLIANRAS